MLTLEVRIGHTLVGHVVARNAGPDDHDPAPDACRYEWEATFPITLGMHEPGITRAQGTTCHRQSDGVAVLAARILAVATAERPGTL